MRIELPAHKRWVHSTTLQVRWCDMDAIGHVNNAVYFSYMEQLRVEWLRSSGIPSTSNGVGAVVVNTFCSYLRQLQHPDEILLKLYVSDPARTTFETWVTMERLIEPGVICATGGATVIWVDTVRQKAVSLPDAVRAIVQGSESC